MSAARALGAMYLATASIFGVAIALNQHPDWQRAANAAGSALLRTADSHVISPMDKASQQEWARLFDSTAPRQATVSVAPRGPIVAVAHNVSRARAHADDLSAALANQIRIGEMLAKKQAAAQPQPRDLPQSSTPDVAPLDLHPDVADAAPPAPPPSVENKGPSIGVAQLAPPRPQMTLAPQAQTPPPPQASLAPAMAPTPPAEIARVVERLRENLTPEMLKNFALFLYVSKASAGPLAQHMYVFDKSANGDLAMKYDWPVSTGRELVEFNKKGDRLPSFTPQGYYELDPDRIYRHYTSGQWDQPMPYAMFFNWIKNGSKTGLAIHAATGDDIPLIGHRASAGCIRLSPDNARVLFSLIRDHYKGLASRFAYDKRTGTMSNDGILLHDAGGHVQMAEGYKVLVFIENYGGNDNIVAALF